jgi:hypothetical protein
MHDGLETSHPTLIATVCVCVCVRERERDSVEARGGPIPRLCSSRCPNVFGMLAGGGSGRSLPAARWTYTYQGPTHHSPSPLT